MSDPKKDGRVVRIASGEIEMLQAEAKRQIWAAHLAMGDAFGSTDPLKFYQQMKIAQKHMIKAEELIDAAQAVARDIQVIAIVAAKRDSYRKEKES